ncbi:hypothetical protein HMPREF0682_0048, partial [Propionibacterium acidifaciens F0233]
MVSFLSRLLVWLPVDSAAAGERRPGGPGPRALTTSVSAVDGGFDGGAGRAPRAHDRSGISRGV